MGGGGGDSMGAVFCIHHFLFDQRQALPLIGSCREAYPDTQTSNGQLAIQLKRLTRYRSGGHEFESPLRRELGALTKKWKGPWGQVFLSTIRSFSSPDWYCSISYPSTKQRCESGMIFFGSEIYFSVSFGSGSYFSVSFRYYIIFF